MHRSPRRCLILAIALAACEPAPGSSSLSDATVGDARVDGWPIPAQQCHRGWVTTDLLGPLPAASLQTAAHVQPLVLAGGPRALASGLSPRLRTCLARSGCLALALLPGGPPWQRLQRWRIHPVEHVQGRYFIVALERGADLRRAMQLGDVAAVDLLRPSDKLAPVAPGAPKDARARQGRIALLASATGSRMTCSLDRLGLPLSRSGELAAAAMPWVYRVGSARSPDVSLGSDVRRSIHTEEVQGFALQGATPTYSGYTGQGIIVAVVDSGVDLAQLDLHAFDAAGQDLGSRVTGDPAAAPHGTGVAAVLAGNGHNSAGFLHDGVASSPYQWRGQAPGASLVSIYKGTPWTPAMLPTHLSNHSYPMSYGTYDNTSAFVDAVIHDGLTPSPPRPMVWAAGNAGLVGGAAGSPVGYYSVSSVAKNPIVVGGSNANDDSFCSWASHGPTYDGRIKPDVVAPHGKDPRPPTGIPLEIDEIRLVARTGSEDQVWSFDQDLQGWTVAAGIESPSVQGGALKALATLGGDAATQQLPLIAGGSLTRGGLTLDAAAYGELQLRMRLQVAEVAGKYHWPDLWVVRWTDATSKEHELFVPFESASKNGEWQTHRATLPLATFNGSLTSLQIEPVAYLGGIVVAAAGTQSYQIVAGTSYAAPAVSGMLALLLQQLKETASQDLERYPPWPSAFKALVIHTARDLIHDSADPRDRNNPDTGAPTLLHRGPDFATGFGLVDARAASDLLATPGRTRAQHLISPQQLHTYRLALGSSVSVRELRATLVWDDPPGNPLLAIDQPQLVNDLDLVAIGPQGKAHGPWLLDPLPRGPPIKPSDVKPARRCVETAPLREDCRDRLNNVEQLVVDRPDAGWWTIEVRAHDVPLPPQRYSLVVTAGCD